MEKLLNNPKFIAFLVVLAVVIIGYFFWYKPTQERKKYSGKSKNEWIKLLKPELMSTWEKSQRGWIKENQQADIRQLMDSRGISEQEAVDDLIEWYRGNSGKITPKMWGENGRAWFVATMRNLGADPNENPSLWDIYNAL